MPVERLDHLVSTAIRVAFTRRIRQLPVHLGEVVPVVSEHDGRPATEQPFGLPGSQVCGETGLRCLLMIDSIAATGAAAHVHYHSMTAG
jgi:hypothetical protein